MKVLLIIILMGLISPVYSQSKYWVYKVAEASINTSSKKMKFVETDADMTLLMNGKIIEIDSNQYNVDQSTLTVSEDNGVTLLSFDAVENNEIPCKIILGTNTKREEYYIRIIKVSNIIDYYYRQ